MFAPIAAVHASAVAPHAVGAGFGDAAHVVAQRRLLLAGQMRASGSAPGQFGQLPISAFDAFPGTKLGSTAVRCACRPSDSFLADPGAVRGGLEGFLDRGHQSPLRLAIASRRILRGDALGVATDARYFGLVLREARGLVRAGRKGGVSEQHDGDHHAAGRHVDPTSAQ
ncbi:MAG: hypothetical protein ABI794_10315 [Betaproteobacteria bacterium]